ncbi:MAG: AAA family ATPase [Candidatus Portnoybacteria bacterium]|nr:AAA family ATPase [Candidatus Portnoybacteria bacterium]
MDTTKARDLPKLLKAALDEYDEKIKKLEKEAQGLQNTISSLQHASYQDHEEYQELQDKYEALNEDLIRLRAEKDVLEEHLGYCEAETELPATYEGMYLEPDETLVYTPPPPENNPALQLEPIEVKRAWVSVHGHRHSLTVGHKINDEDLKFGQLFRVVKHKGEFVAIAEKRKWNPRRSDVEVVKRVLEEGSIRVAILDISPKPQLWPISEFCQDKLEPGDYVEVNREYNIVLGKTPQLEEEVDRKKIDPVTFKDVGGLEAQIEAIKEIVILPFKHPEYFESLGIRPPSSALLTGPPGTGKTLLARATANETNMFFMARSGAQFRSAYADENVGRLELLFKEAKKRAEKDKQGVIIFIDEFESLAPIRKDLHAGQYDVASMVNTYLACMEGLTGRGKIIVLAATNNPDNIDEAARRRFDREIKIPVPGKNGRLEIVKIHSRKMRLDADVDLEEIVDRTHGFTGNDIEHLCIEAALMAKRSADNALRAGDLSKKELSLLLIIRRQHFLEVLKTMRPSGTGDLVITETGITFKDVAGLKEVKAKLLREVYILLGKGGKLAKRAGMKARKGMLLVGWPGGGKTLLAKALASESGMNLIPVKGSGIRIMWVGQSSRNLKDYFDLARRHGPCILFLDEIDSLLPRRGMGAGGVRVDEQLVTTFNEELDGIVALENVLVLAATNRIDLVDAAVIRRLTDGGKPIEVPPLDKEDRKECFEIYTRNKPLADDVNLEELAQITGERKLRIIWGDGKEQIEDFPFNGDEIRSICEEAARLALNEFETEWGEQAEEKAEEFFVRHKHFLTAIIGKREREQKEHEENLAKAPTVSEDEISKAMGEDAGEEFKPELDPKAIKKDFD